MAENKVSVEISLEEKAALAALTKLSREINKTEDSFKKMGDEGDSAFGVVGDAAKGVSDGFGTLVKGVTVANLASDAIIGTANAMKQFVVDSFNAALEAEESINKLSQALRASGSFSQSAVEDFQAYAQALAETTRFSDDEVIAQLALAKSFGATNEQAKKLVSAATELAATYGGTLEQRVEQLGKTLTGTGGKLDSLVPGFKALTEEQLKAGAAFDHITNKLGGSAASQLNSTGGQIGQLTKSFGELQEAFGAFALSLSDLSFIKNATTFIGNLTQKINDLKTESDRSSNGFIENEESVNQLSREYAALTEKLDLAQAAFDRNKKAGAIDFLEQSKIKIFRKELEELEKQINGASFDIVATKKKEAIVAGESPAPVGASSVISDADQKLIDSRREANAQLQIAYVEHAAWEAEQDLLKREITSQNYALELEQLTALEAEKINAKFAAEEQKASLIKDAQTREMTLAKLHTDKQLALEKSAVDAKKKLDQQEALATAQKWEKINQFTQAGAQLASAIVGEGSKEAFLIGKAAALAQVAVSTATGVANALLIPDPTPTQSIRMAAATQAKIMGAISAATITAQAIRGYEQGGVVPGSSYSGDRVMARVNSAEVIMNRQQQANTLMAIANGSAGGDSKIDRLIDAVMSQPINLVVDGRVLATVIRKEVQGGFRLA
jgi:hypothetical protein